VDRKLRADRAGRRDPNPWVRGLAFSTKIPGSEEPGISVEAGDGNRRKNDFPNLSKIKEESTSAFNRTKTVLSNEAIIIRLL